MPPNIDHAELSALSDDVFEALDNVSDTTAPGVARLALTSISMLRFIETAILDMTAKDLDAIEEMRRLQRSELEVAKATEERMNQAIDAAVQLLAIDIAKSVCKFKNSVGGLVAKFEEREIKGADLDERLRVARSTQEHARELLDEPIDLSDLGFVLFDAWDVYHEADFEVDPVLVDHSSYLHLRTHPYLCSRQHHTRSREYTIT